MQTSRLTHSIYLVLFYVYLFCVFSVPVHAAEVTIPFQDLKLNANLELVAGKQIADGVIVITHGGLAHRDIETITYLQSQLTSRGYNTLAINLSLGINNRHGLYDCKVTHRHLHADAADEIDAWIQWLDKEGARQVTLLGHSRGAGQTAFYAAEHDNALVNAVVLMAPQTSDNGGDGYQRRYQQPLQPLLQQAQQLVQGGKGETLLQHANLMFCHDTTVTADTFVSYFGPDPRLNTPTLIPRLKVPTLILVAGEDEIVVGLNKKVTPLVDGKRIKMRVIDGADHFFRDLYTDDAADEIEAFLAEVTAE